MDAFVYLYDYVLLIISMTSMVYAEANQELIMAQDGISLLAMTAADAEDPQTLRMVAGAIANLCGNGSASYLNFYVYIIT